MLRTYRDFLEELRSLIAAGIPVREALQGLAHARGGRVSRIAACVLEGLMAGCTLGEAMAACPRWIPREHAALVEVGEQKGNIDGILLELVERVDARRSAAAELQRSVAWPAFLTCVAVVLLPLYLLVTGEERLYWTIQALFFGPLLLAAAAYARGWLVPQEGTRARVLLETLLLRIPVVGGAIRELAVARVLSLFGWLLKNGGSLQESAELVAGATPWVTLRESILSVPAALRSGKKLSEALRDAGDLGMRPDWVARIQAGEAAGFIDRTLRDIGAELEQRFAGRLRAVIRVLPVLAYLLVGFIILQQALRVMGSVQGAW